MIEVSGENEAESAILFHRDKFTFQVNRREDLNPATATQQTEKVFLSLENNAVAYTLEFQNNECELIETYFAEERKGVHNVRMDGEVKCYSNYSEQIFSSDQQACELFTQIDDEASTVMIRSTKEYRDLRYLTTLYLRSPYYVKERVIEIEVPDWLDLEVLEMNFDGFDIEKSELQVVDKKADMTVYKYTVSNLEPIPFEPQSFGLTYTEPHLVFVCKNYEFKDKETVQLFGTVADQYAWYKGLVDACGNEPGLLSDLAIEITSTATTELDKVRQVFYWVQDKIRYVAFEDGIMGFMPEAAQNVYDNKYGDCKGMANLTKVLLQELGIDARLTWLGTNRISPQYDYSFPSLATDNHMICAVLIDGEILFLDPTEKYSAVGELAERIQGRLALIEDGENYLIEQIPSHDPVGNRISMHTTLDLESNTLKGNRSIKYSGDEKINLIRNYHTMDHSYRDTYIRELLGSWNKDIGLSNVTGSDLTNRDDELVLSSELTIENSVLEIDDEIYVSFEFNNEIVGLSAQDTARITNRWLGRKIDRFFTVNLTIPTGASVSHTKEPLVIENDFYSLTASYKQSDSTLTLTKQITVPSGVIPSELTAQWNEDLEIFQSYNEEHIVLKKER